jgi:hypothetical protein
LKRRNIVSETTGQKKAEANVGIKAVDMKLEVIVIPVADVDRAEKFYRKLGWRQDVTPPVSGNCGSPRPRNTRM